LSADGRFVHNEKQFVEDAFVALAGRFIDRVAFDTFYTTLTAASTRDEFLRVTSFYRYLVKEGDWQIAVQGADPIIDYLTNSYKLVALFSLIESLADLRHEDFYEWLSHRQPAIYPIQDGTELKKLYQQYKESYGSIRRCVAFFDRLPPELKSRLCSAIRVKGQPMASIRKLAEFLYNLRSQFVHEGRLVLDVRETPTYSIGKKGATRSSLTIGALLEAFEVGVIEYFRNET